MVCIETVKQFLVCFNAVQGLFHSLYTSAHGECTASVEWGLYCCSLTKSRHRLFHSMSVSQYDHVVPYTDLRTNREYLMVHVGCKFGDSSSNLLNSYLFYHDVYEIIWPQPIRSLKLGHVTGLGSMSPTWVGRVSDPEKITFIKSVNLDNIAI